MQFLLTVNVQPSGFWGEARVSGGVLYPKLDAFWGLLRWTDHPVQVCAFRAWLPFVRRFRLRKRECETFGVPRVSQVYIGGGGELATAREVLRHKSVEKCVMVDLDKVTLAYVALHRQRDSTTRSTAEQHTMYVHTHVYLSSLNAKC